MFGGKSLKDLTEEDIRKYAASLASGGGEAVASDMGDAEDDGDTDDWQPAVQGSVGDGEEPHRKDASTAIVPATSELEDLVAKEGRQMELARRAREEEQERRKQQLSDLERERQRRLAEEEEMRLHVLADMERSQMPAVQTEEGLLQKAIEHYTFADSEATVSISIELDKDLFDGAAGHVSEDNVEVTTNDSDVTILLRRIPASKSVAAFAEWKLHISPLFHSVEPQATTWKIRKGKVSVKLKKKKAQEWRRLVKF